MYDWYERYEELHVVFANLQKTLFNCMTRLLSIPRAKRFTFLSFIVIYNQYKSKNCADLAHVVCHVAYAVYFGSKL